MQLIAGLVAALVVGVVVVLLLGGGGGGGDLPVATIDSAPSGSVAETSATIAFGSDAEGATFECSLDGAEFASCTSPQTVEVGAGAHSFRVRAVTDAGTGEAASADWTVEGGGPAGPDVTISSGPSGTVADAAATFEFSSGDATATFECSLDIAEFTSCTSPQTYADLTNGQHTFQVQAVSADGATGPVAQQAWTVQVGANEFPNAAEAALLQHIPGGIRSNCSRSDLEADGADAVIFCPANEEFVGVTYFHFQTAADMDAYYDITLTYADHALDDGGCNEDAPGEGEREWSDETVGTSGRVVCYFDEDQNLAALEWNEPSMLIHAWSFHTENDPSALLSWWGRFGGPIP